MHFRERVLSNILGMIGGAVGGFIGYQGFFWITKQGFYALILPGGLIGIGCGLVARHSSLARGAVCAVAAVLLGLFTEWKFRPFVEPNDGFPYLLTHIHQLQPVTLLMIGLGSLIAYWTGKDDGCRGIRLRPPRQT